MDFNRDDATLINKVKQDIKHMVTSYNVFSGRIGFGKSEYIPVTPDGLKDCVIAGGCISSMLRGETPNDYDVFIFNAKAPLLEFVMRYKPGGWVVRYYGGEDEDKEYDLNNDRILMTALNKKTKVQYILTTYQDRHEMLADFDFVHNTGCYVPTEDRLYLTKRMYDAAKTKTLIKIPNKRDIQDWRFKKFKNAGWRTEHDAMLAETDTSIASALHKKLYQLKGGVVAAPHQDKYITTSWGDDDTFDEVFEALSKESQKPNGYTDILKKSLEEEMRDLLQDPYLQTK